ncbi:Glutathione-dependent formaldehyde-activating, GFA [Xenorhabdus nematophila ATCC 19061]|uniref:Glutathione-dependent formaldehyde-activating, GFA n=1 Tax=Xenorhabdus nematophila (strain ATCC 19061 / DSM 3370 / CCUG 14189 / LMG 1036 / NCIMB 9965 / AN6) TaxID=406817 RepID=D3VHK3_XENNA|nr:GFA family protein [Xenorhabdus nematophila]CBJ90648.1 Glutathione-dependent formaldehyde-activating, GFA [Xenorhabdus nematophila ATCC 19061]
MNQGRCLCGSVGIKTSQRIENINACHCKICQKWNGGSFLSVDCKDDLEIEGIENISTYASSEWAERAFCRKCGTHLFFHLYHPSTYYVPVALFEENHVSKLSRQIYVDSKPKYYNFVEKTPMLTQQDILNLFNNVNTMREISPS